MKKNRKTRITQIKDLAYWLDYPRTTYIVQEKVKWFIFYYWKDVAVFDSLQQADTYIKDNYFEKNS